LKRLCPANDNSAAVRKEKPEKKYTDVMIAKEREARSRRVAKERGAGYVEGKVS
jgi:hypothetical protein